MFLIKVTDAKILSVHELQVYEFTETGQKLLQLRERS